MTIKKLQASANYEFECNIDESYENEMNIDEWGCAFIYYGDVGVEYNYCIDNGNNQSAIYYCEICGNDEYMSTFHDEFEHYEIDFSDEDWKKELENAMCSILIEFINER